MAGGILMSRDDIWEELYKDDPEGYQKLLEDRKRWDIEFENKHRLERKKLSKLYAKPTRDQMQETIDSFSEEELVLYTYHLNSVKDAVEKRYHKMMDENMFSVSHTSFKELVMKHSWNEVRKALITEFLDQEENVDVYEDVFSELKELHPTENKDKFVIQMRYVKEEDMHEDTGYYDIVAKKPNDMESYAIEFSPWEEWLGFYCNQKNLEEQGELVFIAHCLWEMTFDGYNQEEIQKTVNELEQRIKEIENDSET